MEPIKPKMLMELMAPRATLPSTLLEPFGVSGALEVPQSPYSPRSQPGPEFPEPPGTPRALQLQTY